MSLTKRIVLAASIFSLAVCAFVVMATSDSWLPILKNKLGFSDSPYVPRPTGTVIITGVKLNGEGIEALPQNYAWDMTDPTSGWERVGDVSRGVVYSAFLEPTSIDRPLSAFLRVFAIDPQEKKLQEWVTYADLVNGQASFLMIDMAENPKQFAWSQNSGLLAYQAEERVSSPSGTVSVRDMVRVYDPESRSVSLSIPEAMQPFWSPDGVRLVYLKDSGVYYYDLRQEKEELLMGVQDYDPADRYVDDNTKIGLSSDGRYLAWTSPSINKLFIFEIKSWEPVQMETVQVIDDPSAHFYWPIFSPDSRLVSVQAITVDPVTGFRADPKLRVYSIGSLDSVAEIPLSDFDFDQLFTDTWVNVSLSDFDLDSYFRQVWSVIRPSIFQP